MSSTTVILGSGIIGVSTAYYLSQSVPGSSIHLIDSSPELFASASGNAGGFLAADWFSPSVAALGKLSFAEHKRLADEFDGKTKWGYSRSSSVSYTAGSGKRTTRGDDSLRQGTSRASAAGDVTESVDDDADSNDPAWLSRTIGDSVESISGEGSTAQVDPRRLCHFLLDECLQRGVQLHQPARAQSVDKDMRDELSNIRIVNTETKMVSDIPCTKILIAAGAWSPEVFSTLFPNSHMKLPISSLAGHSLVVRSPRWSQEHEEKGCHAIFTNDEAGYSPEIFSRTGGEIYIAGLNSSTLSLPNVATDSNIDEKATRKLKKTARRLLGMNEDVDDLEVVRQGLCFRPVTNLGTPILTCVSDNMLGGMSTRGAREGGLWIAAGHGPWGISLSLGTGRVMADMILGQPVSVDVSGLRM